MRWIVALVALTSVAPLVWAQSPSTSAGNSADFSGLLSDLGVAPQSRPAIPSLLELNLPPFSLDPHLAVPPVPSDRLAEHTSLLIGSQSNTPRVSVSDEDLMSREWAVNINTASVELLSATPLIGRLRAEAIVQFREANGPFRSPSEIREVFGITEAAFLSLSDHLICRGETTLLATARTPNPSQAPTTR